MLIRHIEYLLSTHDCVVVPGLGAFLATAVSAEYVADRGMFKSPGRAYSFNESLAYSDGLLTMSVARSLGVEYQSACKKVSSAVTEIKKELEQNGEFTVGSIGRLEVTAPGSLSFIPYEHDRLTPLNNWIGELKLGDREESATVHLAEASSLAAHISRPRRFSRFVRTAAGAAAAILLALVVSTPIRVNTPDGDTYKASTVVPVTAPRCAVVPEAVTETDTLTNDEQNVKVTEVSEPETVKATSKVENRVTASSAVENTAYAGSVNFNEDEPYVLVIASLSTRQDAALFVANNSHRTGLKMDITDAGGKYRVYVATGETYAQASAQKNRPEIRRHFKDAWATARL